MNKYLNATVALLCAANSVWANDLQPEYPQPFLGIHSGGYQLAFDNNYDHNSEAEMSSVNVKTVNPMDMPVVLEALPKTYIIDANSKSYRVTFNSVQLSEQDTTELNEVIQVVNTYPQRRVEFVGHKDSTGSKVSNQKLSEQRAQAAKRALENSVLKNKAVNQKQLNVQGKGKPSPIAGNDTAKWRAKNRIADLTTLPIKDLK